MYVCTYVCTCCQFPLAGYCWGTARARGLIFSHIVGPVQPFVVLKFGARAAFGSPVAGASLPPFGPGLGRRHCT